MPDIAVIGRYWPGTSPLHRMDARAKLLLALALMAVVFVAQSFLGLAVCAAFVFGFFRLAGIPLRSAFKSIAPLAFIVVVTALLNVFFVQGGAVLFEWWIIRISEAGLWQAAFIACRLLLLLLGMSLLTLTTATLDITDAFEYLLRPFRRIGVPAHELSMMMGIALRFLPQFTFELQTVYRAQISRGATFSKGRLRMLAYDGARRKLRGTGRRNAHVLHRERTRGMAVRHRRQLESRRSRTLGVHSPSKSRPTVVSRPPAMRSSMSTVGFAFPLSISMRYLRLTPTMRAKEVCDTLASERSLAILVPS